MALAAVVARPTDQDTDDLDLVAGVRAGDERAFELLYLRYHGRIAAYVRSMVHDHGRAEDITQEVFISALRRMRETDREIAFKPWMYEIAKNACIDAFRRSRHRNEVSFDAHDALGAGDYDRLAGMGARPDTAVDTKADLDNLRGAFGGLSEVHHQILVMRELEGLSYRDIGERLGMSRPAVESTLFRARRRLGEEYEELVSGKRCLRVRAIVDGAGRSAGVRDRRRMDRHISHCQPCRRYALAAGVDLEPRPSLRPAAAKIAALLPLPAFVRHRIDGDAAQQLLGSQGQATVAHWSTNVAGSVDPGTLVGWSKAVVAAATVAVAGVGAGAAITEREALHDFVSRAPAIAGLGDAAGAAPDGSGVQLRRREDAALPVPGGGRSQTRGGGVFWLPGGFGGAFATPGESMPALTRDRDPGPVDGAGRGGPPDAGKPLGGASPGANTPGPAGLGPVDDVLPELVDDPGSASGDEPSTMNASKLAAGVGSAVGDISSTRRTSSSSARCTACRKAEWQSRAGRRSALSATRLISPRTATTGSTLSDVGTTAAAESSGSQPVANVAKSAAKDLTTAVDTALPGT